MGIATPTAEVINECSQVKVVVSMKARNSSFSFKWLLDDGNGYVALAYVSLDNANTSSSEKYDIKVKKNSDLSNKYQFEISNDPDRLSSCDFPSSFTSTLTFNIEDGKRNQKLTFKVVDDDQASSDPKSIIPSEHCSGSGSNGSGSNDNDGGSNDNDGGSNDNGGGSNDNSGGSNDNGGGSNGNGGGCNDNDGSVLIALVVIGCVVITAGIILPFLYHCCSSWLRSHKERKPMVIHCGIALLGVGIVIIGVGLIVGLPDNIRALPGGTVLIVYGVFLLSAAIILSVKKNKERNIKLEKLDIDLSQRRSQVAAQQTQQFLESC